MKSLNKTETPIFLSVVCSLFPKANCFDVFLGKCCPGDSHFIFYQIFIRLLHNKYKHKVLDDFNFGSDQTIHMIVTCHLVSVRQVRLIATLF